MRNFLLRLLILIVYIVAIPITFVWVPVASIILGIFCPPLYWLFTGKDIFTNFFIYWVNPWHFFSDIITKIEKIYK